MKKQKFWLNIISSYGVQVITTICSFILPRVFLSEYGSAVNGLVSSITQYLAVISLTDMGITVVVQSSLYKPLAEKDNDTISRILVSAQKFYTVVGIGLVAYSAILCIWYPTVINTKFDSLYIVGLIVILSIDSLAQYMFGITRSQLLNADQKKYVVSISSAVARILNTVICCVLVYYHASIHLVKLVSAIVFLINPITYNWYVRKYYSVNWKIKYQKEPINQKWNGVARHISSYVFDNTDVLLLTAFSRLEKVSVYAVYNMILKGINQLVSVISQVIQPMLGEYWATNEKDKFAHYFFSYEWVMQTMGHFIFGCTLTLIVPFVQVYTNGINDANYIVPLFASIVTLAGEAQFLRISYGTVIGSVGHFKQTQSNYVVCAVMNLTLSIILINPFGLVGVAVPTLIASLYMYLWQGIYVYKLVLKVSLRKFFAGGVKTLIIMIVGYIATSPFHMYSPTYLGWIVLAIINAVIWGLVVLIANIFFDRTQMRVAVKEVIKIVKK